MGDSSEELEPLFDYSRVQPVTVVNIEDDSDSSPVNSPKRRKCSKNTNNNEDNNDDKGKSVQVIDSEEEEEDEKENWLPPPPPKNVGNPLKIHEDSTIKELRLKRQQLVSVVQSTEHALRAAGEAARRTLSTSSHSDTEETTEEILKPAVGRTKIVVSIQDKAGVKQYRVYADDKFEQLFKNYALKANTDVHNLVFCFDGDKINPATTPQILGMEDDDLIEVHAKAS